VVLHVDCDAFYTQVSLQQIDPFLVLLLCRVK
jgi:nucleotidyltransferase/DNA polymerase involved in DNA repair